MLALKCHKTLSRIVLFNKWTTVRCKCMNSSSNRGRCSHSKESLISTTSRTETSMNMTIRLWRRRERVEIQTRSRNREIWLICRGKWRHNIFRLIKGLRRCLFKLEVGIDWDQQVVEIMVKVMFKSHKEIDLLLQWMMEILDLED